MLFALAVIAIWVIFVVLFHRFNKTNFSFAAALLPLLVFSVLITIDLGINYAMTFDGDGLGMHGVISQFILGDDLWTPAMFARGYQVSFLVSGLLTIAYMASKILSKTTKHK